MMSWDDWAGDDPDAHETPAHETPAHDTTEPDNVWAWWTPERLAAALWLVCLLLALALTPGAV